MKEHHTNHIQRQLNNLSHHWLPFCPLFLLVNSLSLSLRHTHKPFFAFLRLLTMWVFFHSLSCHILLCSTCEILLFGPVVNLLNYFCPFFCWISALFDHKGRFLDLGYEIMGWSGLWDYGRKRSFYNLNSRKKKSRRSGTPIWSLGLWRWLNFSFFVMLFIPCVKLDTYL